MSLNMSGASGELRRSYRVVARLSAWTLDDSGHVDAQISNIDDYWFDDGPFVLRLHVGRTVWHWQKATLRQHEDARVVLVVEGSPERRAA